MISVHIIPYYWTRVPALRNGSTPTRVLVAAHNRMTRRTLFLHQSEIFCFWVGAARSRRKHFRKGFLSLSGLFPCECTPDREMNKCETRLDVFGTAHLPHPAKSCPTRFELMREYPCP